jgi:hypothetical protein
MVIGALAWNPQIKGALYVIIAVAVLPGAGFLLLSTNMGARVGFMLAAAGFCGWMATLSGVWWIYGTGPKGKEPTWKSREVVVGDAGSAGRSDSLKGFPAHWRKLDPGDPSVADALPVAEGKIVGPKAMFKSASDFVMAGAAERGGEAYGPLHLVNLRPFNIFHEPHYLLVQVQRAVKPPAVAGQPPPKAVADPQAPQVSVLMVRDLGSLRKNPAVVCISFSLLFGVVCYRLHVRDREAAAQRG